MKKVLDPLSARPVPPSRMMTMRELAAACQVLPHTMTKALKRHGIPRRMRKIDGHWQRVMTGAQYNTVIAAYAGRVPADDLPDWLTAAEAGAVLGIGANSLREGVKVGRYPVRSHATSGGARPARLFHAGDLQAIVEARPVAPHTVPTGHLGMQAISDALACGGRTPFNWLARGAPVAGRTRTGGAYVKPAALAAWLRDRAENAPTRSRTTGGRASSYRHWATLLEAM